MKNEKTRNISPYDFLQALQQEYICAEIRSKIYIHRNDKDYFKGVMAKKEAAIITLSHRNRINNVIEDEVEYLRVWGTIVPAFGIPNLIYNIINVSDKQLQFPYTGTAVEIVNKNTYGVSERVDFQRQEIVVKVFGEQDNKVYPICDVKRLNHEDTDEFFYFYPGNNFHCTNHETGVLDKYDMKKKTAHITFNKTNTVILHQDDITRIL